MCIGDVCRSPQERRDEHEWRSYADMSGYASHSKWFHALLIIDIGDLTHQTFVASPVPGSYSRVLNSIQQRHPYVHRGKPAACERCGVQVGGNRGARTGPSAP